MRMCFRSSPSQYTGGTSCQSPTLSDGGSSNTYEALDLDRVLGSTEVGHLKRLHVENIDALELSEQLETLETGGLLLVGGDLTCLGTLALDNGRSSSESERRRSEETRGRVDGSGGHAQSGGCAGDETTGGEKHVERKRRQLKEGERDEVMREARREMVSRCCRFGENVV